MKVLMIAPQPFFEPRGTPISVFQRLQGLSRLGYEVDLVTYHVGDDVEIPGVSVHRTPRLPFVNDVRIGPSWTKLILDILLFLKSLQMLIRGDYSVIHSHEEAAFFVVPMAWIFRTPHLYDMHSQLSKQIVNFNFLCYSPVIKFFEMMEKLVIKTCEVVITIGADLEDYVLLVKHNAKHVRIENIAINSLIPVDNERAKSHVQYWGLQDKHPVVYTGTFEGYQGLDLLIDCASRLKDAEPSVVFILVGGKPAQIAYWKAEAERVGADVNVLFVGSVSLEESLEYIELSEIIVSPRTVGLSVPLKIYTYLQSGKPIIATDIPAHSLVLDSTTSVLVEPNADAMADGILQLLRAPDRQRSLGEAAQYVAEHRYGLTSYLAHLTEAYVSACSTGHLSKKASFTQEI